MTPDPLLKQAPLLIWESHTTSIHRTWTKQGQRRGALRDSGQQKASSFRKSRARGQKPSARHLPAVCVIVQLHNRPAVPLQGGVVIAVPVDVPQHWGERKGEVKETWKHGNTSLLRMEPSSGNSAKRSMYHRHYRLQSGMMRSNKEASCEPWEGRQLI